MVIPLPFDLERIVDPCLVDILDLLQCLLFVLIEEILILGFVGCSCLAACGIFQFLKQFLDRILYLLVYLRIVFGLIAELFDALAIVALERFYRVLMKLLIFVQALSAFVDGRKNVFVRGLDAMHRILYLVGKIGYMFFPVFLHLQVEQLHLSFAGVGYVEQFLITGRIQAAGSFLDIFRFLIYRPLDAFDDGGDIIDPDDDQLPYPIAGLDVDNGRQRLDGAFIAYDRIVQGLGSFQLLRYIQILLRL